MPIVINEFEIVPAPPSASPTADARPDPTPDPPPPRPEDIERIVAWHRRRLARLWAD